MTNKMNQQLHIEGDGARYAADRLMEKVQQQHDRGELTSRENEQLIKAFQFMVEGVQGARESVLLPETKIEGKLTIVRALASLVSDEELAAVCLFWGFMTCLNKDLSVQGTYKSTLAASLGQKIIDQMCLSDARNKDLRLYNRIAEHVTEWDARTLGKLKVKLNLDARTFTAHEAMQIGGYFIDLMCHNIHAFELVEKTTTKRTYCWFRLNDKCVDIINDKIAQDCAMAFTKLPMVVQPEPHATCDGTGGGWFYSPLSGVGASKDGNHGTGVEENLHLPRRYAAEVDRLASTAYEIRHDVLDVAKEVLQSNLLWKKGDGGLFAFNLKPRLKTPAEAKGNDDWWKTEEGQAFSYEREAVDRSNAQLKGQKHAITMAVEIADRFRDEDDLFFPVSCDTRGRVYYRPAYLSPQGDSFCKGVLQATKGKALGVAGVNAVRTFIGTFVTEDGIDKAGSAKQIQWTIDNESLLREVAADPINTLDVWGKTDSPFEFLAATFELVAALDSGDPTMYISKLPVRIDAVASGLQHLGAISRDEQVAPAVQLVPGADGPDFYVRVADQTNLLLDAMTTEWWKKLVGKSSSMKDWDVEMMAQAILDLGGTKRKDAKPVSMQRTYAVTERTIAERLLDSGWRDKLTVYYDVEDRKQLNTLVQRTGMFLAYVQFAAVNSYASKAMDVMQWYQDCVKLLGDEGWEYINPAGFTFRQSYRKTKKTRIPTVFGLLTMETPVPGLNAKRQVNGISANQTHCLDACLLIMAAERCDNMFLTVIHDSMGCLAADLPRLHQAVRQAHVDIYSLDRLAEMRTQNMTRTGIELPPVPELGTLDPHLVLESEGYWA